MTLTRPSLRLLVLPGLAGLAVLLSGCATSNPCGGNTDYMNARDRPKLSLPEGVTGSERLGGGTAMNIPPAAPVADKLDPQPECLDHPPPYAAPKKTAPKPAADGAGPTPPTN